MSKKKIKWKIFKPYILICSILALALIVGVLNELSVRRNLKNVFREVEIGDIEELREKEEEFDLIISLMDDATWYQNKIDWYGLAVKYPKTWKRMAPEKASKKEQTYEYKYAFRDPDSKIFLGFEIKIYDKKKVADLMDTDEIALHKKKEDISSCEISKHKKLEKEEYYVEEVNVFKDNDCASEMFFYSFDQNGYIYNFIPILSDNYKSEKKLRNNLITYLPEFFTAVNTIHFGNLIRPKPKPPQPKYPGAPYPAPYPAVYKKVNGKLVCNKKNDKPRKSKQNKKKHWDRECCLDPDEWPNPYCTY